MSSYRISNPTSGHSFGVYEADSAEAAIDACCRDAGYKGTADMEAQIGRECELQADDLSRYASDWHAWCEYIDTGRAYSRAEWDAMTHDQRMTVVLDVARLNA